MKDVEKLKKRAVLARQRADDAFLAFSNEVTRQDEAARREIGIATLKILADLNEDARRTYVAAVAPSLSPVACKKLIDLGFLELPEEATADAPEAPVPKIPDRTPARLAEPPKAASGV
ncbi:glycoside hydrolase [Cereibacter azotoformans]|uniref:Uncharacterized protein n=1 Tax=Cereibacter azotoformans TaxID=43057 RepID=A0A2T5JSQ3_9RHOB|nr:glycoside hydrolase [Cereibacter azotoformans]PTR11631.1 hypothetical protein C8J28_12623 [Cereibacter azotoformans]